LADDDDEDESEQERDENSATLPVNVARFDEKDISLMSNDQEPLITLES
jgi:hypothetical protein